MRAIPALAALLLLCPLAALAGPDRVSFLIGSEHLGAEEEFEEFNPGIFLTWEHGVDLTAGVFRNSYGSAAPSVTISAPLVESGEFALSWTAGLAYYPGDGDRIDFAIGDVVPLLGLRADLGPIFIQAFPVDGETADAVIAFGVTIDLD